MKKWSVCGAVVVGIIASSAGCAGLLGLDDKGFGDTGGTTSTSSGGTTSSGGATSSGGTGGTGGSGAGTTGHGGTTSGGGTTSSGGTTASGGSTGTDCLAGLDLDHLQDEFDYPLCAGADAATTLKTRGWQLAWQDEMYPVPPIGLTLNTLLGQVEISVMKSVYWFDGEAGPFLRKPVSGAFLIVADVALSSGSDPQALPQDTQVGVGILVRDPESADGVLERWLAVDRGAGNGAAAVHGSWSDGLGAPNQGSVSIGGSASGKIALCRGGNGQFSIWVESGGTWTSQPALLGSYPQGIMPDFLEAGLFLYAYDSPKLDVIMNGVKGAVLSVHQYDPGGGSCDPTTYGE